MADPVANEIKLACDDLYCAPLDPVAQSSVREMLLRVTPAPEPGDLVRRIRIACDELHDDPDDMDARHTLLSLITPTPLRFRTDVPSPV